MPNSPQMRFFKPDLSSLGGVFKAPKLGPRHDKMAAHVSESPTTVLLPKGYDDTVKFSVFFVVVVLFCILANIAFMIYFLGTCDFERLVISQVKESATFSFFTCCYNSA